MDREKYYDNLVKWVLIYGLAGTVAVFSMIPVFLFK